MVKIVAFNNEKDWNKFAFRYSYSYFLQSWDWGEVNLDLANKIYRYGIFKGERLVGIFLAILQKAQRGPLSYQSLIVPAGPLIDYSNSNQVKEVFEFIEQLAKKEGADFVRVRPPILAGPEAVLLFKKSGYKAAPTHLHAEITLQLDLFQSEEELLKQMRKTTRYSIRKAEKDGVTIKVSTDPEDAKIIYHLQEATVGRHKFAPFPTKYFEAQLKHFGQNSEALLYWAQYQGKPIAAALIVFFGQTAVYHLGASSNEFRHLTASHLIQWEAIREAKKRGCQFYNFWGIIEEDNKNHPWYGLSLFKKGFGGEVVKFFHAQDRPLSFKYPAIYVFETLRRKKRRL